MGQIPDPTHVHCPPILDGHVLRRPNPNAPALHARPPMQKWNRDGIPKHLIYYKYQHHTTLQKIQSLRTGWTCARQSKIASAACTRPSIRLKSSACMATTTTWMGSFIAQ